MALQCRTCGDHGKDGLSLLDPEHASLLHVINLQFVETSSSFVCHDCVVEMKHWSNFLHRFQTSQTRFQQVLHTQQTDVPLKVARVLVPKLLECDFCCFYTDNKTQLATHMQAHLHTTNTTDGTRKRPANEGWKLNHKCAECGLKYRHPEMMRWHTENCHGPAAIIKVVNISNKQHRFQCVFCLTECKYLEVLIQHLHNQHRIQNFPFHCNLCGKQFIRIFYLEKHQHKCKKRKTVSDGPSQDSVNLNDSNNVEVCKQSTVKCKLCKEMFQSELLLKDHISQFHAVKRVHNKCLHCEESFISFFNLKTHCHTRHPGKHVLQCDVCNAGFTSHYGYWCHKKNKHENHTFTCNICNAEFASHGGCIRHKKYKHGETRVFICNICSTSFSRPDSLSSHKEVVHCQLTKSFSCQFCSAEFKCKRYLSNHVLNLHTGKNLHCDHCTFNTRRNSLLILHLRVKHSLVKNTFACQFCSAKFKCKQYLQNHVRSVHTGAILHCNHCNYNTRRRSDFILHLRVKHSLVKNTFACQFCSAKFKCKQYLRTHIRHMHT